MRVTKDEFLEKFGNIQVQFKRYFKYEFEYIGVTEDGDNISVMVGGNSDDIYDHEVVPNTYVSVASLDPMSGEITHGSETKMWYFDAF